MSCGCNKSKKYEDNNPDKIDSNHNRYAYLTPAQLHLKKIEEERQKSGGGPG